MNLFGNMQAIGPEFIQQLLQQFMQRRQGAPQPGQGLGIGFGNQEDPWSWPSPVKQPPQRPYPIPAPGTGIRPPRPRPSWGGPMGQPQAGGQNPVLEQYLRARMQRGA